MSAFPPPHARARPGRCYNSSMSVDPEPYDLFPDVAEDRRTAGRDPLRVMSGTPTSAPHCPNCDYNLYGLESPRCPECGLELDAAALSQGRWHAFDQRANRRVMRFQSAFVWAGMIGFALGVPGFLFLGPILAAVFSLFFAAGVGILAAFSVSLGGSVYPAIGLGGILYFASLMLFLAMRFL